VQPRPDLALDGVEHAGQDQEKQALENQFLPLMK
jgi:hypothetical protein